ncbi:MAG: PSD1 domain-containing protein [Planctomycetales bacterium]|nr:PSD1 domain-containing protein [Planctomycetales bacterium]
MHPLKWLIACNLLMVIGFANPVAAADSIEFNRDIRPILSAACFKCHGFDEKARQADLRLDEAESLAGVLKAGDPSESSLWQRIIAESEEEIMPPRSEKRQLSDDERQTIQRWIEQGGKFQQHWSIAPLTPSTIPLQAANGFPHWQTNAVDQFLLAKMLEKGLTPQGVAGKEVLIRRLAFTLTGLPPTVDEIDCYLQDESDDAYEKVVDHYLQSPHYGEEMARHWLDVARYGDTHGLHLDNLRDIWAYRDWVVQAFNENKHFDQFTIEQIAGDLLENPTQSQLIATGFNRCNVTTSEGGALNDEFLFRYAVDRTATTFGAWLGVTGGCAVCHDHKYDPVSMIDFYSFYAFFYSNADPAMDGNRRDTPPYLRLETPAQTLRLASLRQRLTSHEHALNEVASQMAGDWDRWQAQTANAPAAPVWDVWLDDSLPPGASGRNTGRNAEAWYISEDVPLGNRALELAFGDSYTQDINGGLTPRVIPEKGVIEFWLRIHPKHSPQAFYLELATTSGTRRLGLGEVSALGKGEFTNNKNLHLGDLPPGGQWKQYRIEASRLELDAGTMVESLTLGQVGGICQIDALGVRGSRASAVDPRASLENWLQANRGKDVAGLPQEVAQAIKQEKVQESQQILKQVRVEFLKWIARNVPVDLQRARELRHETWLELTQLEADIPGTLIYRELDTPRQAHVMARGQYDAPTTPVKPATPSFLPGLQPKADGSDLNRLDLAKWLVSPENPLPARVTVNRFWQQIFGTGIVKTSDDFGMQGSPPSHPELLDWLANEFVHSGWDVKQLMRRLVTSQAFRQTTYQHTTNQSIDPDNRFLARGPRIRLDAEQIRDASLAAGGIINLKLGGPGFLGYQPPGIWEPVGYANSNTRYYLQDVGEDIYRRSLYSFVKRTAPPPFMTNFDAPNREMICTRRERSNTPLQALQLMNDVQHVEAARALAERVCKQTTGNTGARVDSMFRIVLARWPDAFERQELSAVVEEFQKRFSSREADAQSLIEMGQSTPDPTVPSAELASYTMLANLILNLDEAVTRN